MKNYAPNNNSLKNYVPVIKTHSPLNRPKPARLSILLCLTLDDFTRQWGTPGSQWVTM